MWNLKVRSQSCYNQPILTWSEMFLLHHSAGEKLAEPSSFSYLWTLWFHIFRGRAWIL